MGRRREGTTAQERAARQWAATMLHDTVVALLGAATSSSGQARRRVAAIEAWLAADDRLSPLSFMHVCEVLDFEPDRLRAVLKRVRREFVKQGKRR